MSRGNFWVTEPDQVIEPRLAKTGFGSIVPKTVHQAFLETVKNHGDVKALAHKRTLNGQLSSDWTVWTWKDYYNDCRKFAKSLVHFNVSNFKIINILGFNSPEWFIANTGSILAGCIAAGIYSTNSSDACHYISKHSKAEVVVLENNKQLEKYALMTTPLPHLKCIVVWNEPADKTLAAKCGVPVYSWEVFLHFGARVTDSALDDRIKDITPGHCASLIYTSGTTGPPKAVMISHDNLTWTAANVVTNGYVDLGHTDRIISYLPLSHIAAQLVDIHCMMKMAGCTYFAQPDALKGSLTVSMKEIRPTFFFAVPRVWEKIQEKMMQMGRETTGIKKVLSTWAKSRGTVRSEYGQYGHGGGAPWGYNAANALVLSKIKEALGLDAAKGCFTAAAPITRETLNYFASLDIPVYEIFGQSECTGPHTMSAAKCWKIGACGRPIQGSESKILSTTGELCYRGRHIFMGYMHMPALSAETIDEEGFLHSGDVAEFDKDVDEDVTRGQAGFMRITGRIKELIITAGGENVPPVLIENEMKAAMLAISNVMVIGDCRKYLSMVVSLKTEVDVESGALKDELAADALFVGAQINSTAKLYSQAILDDKWAAYIDAGLKQANKKTTSNAQIVQKWRWLPVDFSEKEGDLTPTLKLKRSVVSEKNLELIDSIYQEEEDSK